MCTCSASCSICLISDSCFWHSDPSCQVLYTPGRWSSLCLGMSPTSPGCQASFAAQVWGPSTCSGWVASAPLPLVICRGHPYPLRVTSGEWFYCLLPSPHRKVTSKAVRMRKKSVPCTHRRKSAFIFVLLMSVFLAALASDPLAEIPYLLLFFQQGNPLFWLCQNYMLKSNKSWFQRPW